jgi:hypothetical protein
VPVDLAGTRSARMLIPEPTALIGKGHNEMTLPREIYGNLKNMLSALKQTCTKWKMEHASASLTPREILVLP